MTEDEYAALNTDHPDWVNLSYDELRAKYWAYDLTVVRLARAEAHLRLAMKPLERVFLWIARPFERWNR